MTLFTMNSRSLKTWPLFNKKEQEFADAYDQAVKQLKEEKKTSELSTEFYGRDLFEVLDDCRKITYKDIKGCWVCICSTAFIIKSYNGK